MPDELAERGIAVRSEVRVALRDVTIEKIARNSRRWAEKPVRGIRTIFRDRVSFDSLLKPVQAGDIVDFVHAVRRDPEFLTVLDLTRRNVLKRLDDQRRVIPIVRGI